MPLHGVASVHPVTLGPEVDVELLTHCLLMSLHWCFAPMPFVDPLVQPVPHRLASKARPSDLPVLLKYLCLGSFDLDFDTVSSILVFWTEEHTL